MKMDIDNDWDDEEYLAEIEAEKKARADALLEAILSLEWVDPS